MPQPAQAGQLDRAERTERLSQLSRTGDHRGESSRHADR
nr:hypothetical protein [Kibdelosporangium sp. MJ126-NF4]